MTSQAVATDPSLADPYTVKACSTSYAGELTR